MTVHTVNGPVTPTGEGMVLPHEHLVIDYRQMAGAAPPPSLEEEDHATRLLRRLAADGVEFVVDATPPGYGRDLAFLRRVSERSGVHIVASTGTFCEQFHRQPPWVNAMTVTELAAAFEAELGRGCGAIKVATSHGEMRPRERLALQAASLAQQRTGSPIISHTTGSLGVEQVELFASAGVALDKVLVSHVCADTEPDDYAVEIAARGAYVGLDRIGHAAHADAHWLRIIGRLLDAGLAARILLSHDSVQRFDGPQAIAGETFSRIGHLGTEFRRQVTEAFGEELFTRLTVHNPVAWLTNSKREDA
ncbi:MAG: hypothetical protein QM628_02940 [Propionicimonas sp.]